MPGSIWSAMGREGDFRVGLAPVAGGKIMFAGRDVGLDQRGAAVVRRTIWRASKWSRARRTADSEPPGAWRAAQVGVFVPAQEGCDTAGALRVGQGSGRAVRRANSARQAATWRAGSNVVRA